MSTDYDHSIKRVQDAAKARDRARKELNDVQSRVLFGLNALQHPMAACATTGKNASGDTTVVDAKYVVYADKWPRFDDLKSAIEGFQKAESDCRASRAALSQEDLRTIGDLGL